MDADRLKALFDTYGGDPRRWPDRDRAAYPQQPADDVSDAAEQARALDRLLDAWVVEPASIGLRQRILNQATASAGGRMGWRPLELWVQGACLAAACAAGVLAGLSLGQIDRSSRTSLEREAESVAVMYDVGTIAGAQTDETT